MQFCQEIQQLKQFQLSDLRNDLLSVTADTDRRPDMADYSFFVNEHSDSLCDYLVIPLSFNAVICYYYTVSISDQVKIQAVFCFKCFVGLGVIDADTDNNSIFRRNNFHFIAK